MIYLDLPTFVNSQSPTSVLGNISCYFTALFTIQLRHHLPHLIIQKKEIKATNILLNSVSLILELWVRFLEHNFE